MRNAVRFASILTVGLAGLSLVGYLVLERTTRRWFESDVSQRSRLAVGVARHGLIESLGTQKERTVRILSDISRDDRIMGAAVCSPEGRLVAATEGFPGEFGCDSAGLRAQAEGNQEPSVDKVVELATGLVQLSGVSLTSDGRVHGTVLLVHDLSFLSRRATTTRNLSLLAFFVLSLVASLVTLVSMRLAWKDWLAGFRNALAGKEANRFAPLMSDVRKLVEELAAERSVEAGAGTWDPERLKATLTRHLSGERVLILANREPYVHERGTDGIRVLHPASGLVTALEPVMRACSGVWIAHGSGSADRETADESGRILVPPGEESYAIRRIWLSEAEEQGYYYGLANDGLWPLCHVAHMRPAFRASDWESYVEVNHRFARAVVEEADTEDPIVFVQDYHFALAPKMIRDLLPRATILTFWHIPWPNAERVGICPWREEILSGLLGSSIVGFHTRQHCLNFIDSVDAFLESRIEREHNAIVQRSRRTLVRPYPISIEWPVHWLEELPDVAECRRTVRERLQVPEDTMLGVGVDRLDYTKGLEERFQAVNDLMNRYPEFRGRFTFVQVAAPSRTKIDRYRQLGQRIAALANAINSEWSHLRVPPITLLKTHHEPAEVFRLFRAAELCYVSSLHDGMNLVAKEFVAAREDERGVLILSEFTGAARDLTEALIVNPYDIREASDALATALRMPLDQQRERMRPMRRMLSEFNVYRWAGRILMDAADLRRRDRRASRLTQVRTRLAGEA